MDVKIITAASGYPVTEDEVNLYLKIDNDEESILIKKIIASATEFTEKYLKRSLLIRTLVASFDNFPTNEIKLPYSPVTTINSVKYYDDNYVLTTVDPSIYFLVSKKTPAEVNLKFTNAWPITADRSSAVEVEYIAGYGKPENVPEPIKQAILLLCNHLYSNREMVSEKSLSNAPMSYNYLLSSYRILQFSNKSMKDYV